jgi:A/G-specific adenine glycosylase
VAQELRHFQSAVLGWYRTRARPLRIRTTREPWAILLAEVMAQQTQISRVEAAWAAFLDRFPTPARLAEAPASETLRAWSGLGYNRRALNLHRAAQDIVTRHGGRVPCDVAELEALPGVGPYTARAVAATAFGRPVGAVDTNVRRVLTRVVGRDLSARELQARADELVDGVDPASWTHAVMDLGALVCRPRRPDCASCPISRWCVSAGMARRPEATARPRGLPFEHTSRWLRGRIVARLRDLEDGAWARMPEVIGSHGPDGIAMAVAALRHDGLVEERADGAVRLPAQAP